MELEKMILNDLNEGLTYNQIIKKYNLKSNYLIKKVKGLKNTCKYITININVESIKKLTDVKLTTITAYIININKIIKNKNISKLLNILNDEMGRRDAE